MSLRNHHRAASLVGGLVDPRGHGTLDPVGGDHGDGDGAPETVRPVRRGSRHPGPAVAQIRLTFCLFVFFVKKIIRVDLLSFMLRVVVVHPFISSANKCVRVGRDDGDDGRVES